MESHEVLRDTLKKTSPKAVAADLGVSLSLVYKWAEKPSADGSGSRNPIDRLMQIIELSEDTGILEWMCRQKGGYFIKDSNVSEERAEHVLHATQEIIGQFSSLLTGISAAAADDSVCPKEAAEIRIAWDKLKSYAEAFVRSCEAGHYQNVKQ